MVETPQSGIISVRHEWIASGYSANDCIKPLLEISDRNGWGGSCARKTKYYFAFLLTHSLQTSYTTEWWVKNL